MTAMKVTLGILNHRHSIGDSFTLANQDDVLFGSGHGENVRFLIAKGYIVRDQPDYRKPSIFTIVSDLDEAIEYYA